MVDLTGRIALVTGAVIGRAIALRLAEAGADVSLFDIDEASVRDTADNLRALERKAAVSRGNVASRADVVAVVRALLSRRSGHPNESTDVVVFLASEHAAYITGKAVNNTGGLWMN